MKDEGSPVSETQVKARENTGGRLRTDEPAPRPFRMNAYAPSFIPAHLRAMVQKLDEDFEQHQRPASATRETSSEDSGASAYDQSTESESGSVGSNSGQLFFGRDNSKDQRQVRQESRALAKEEASEPEKFQLKSGGNTERSGSRGASPSQPPAQFPCTGTEGMDQKGVSDSVLGAWAQSYAKHPSATLYDGYQGACDQNLIGFGSQAYSGPAAQQKQQKNFSNASSLSEGAQYQGGWNSQTLGACPYSPYTQRSLQGTWANSAAALQLLQQQLNQGWNLGGLNGAGFGAYNSGQSSWDGWEYDQTGAVDAKPASPTKLGRGQGSTKYVLQENASGKNSWVPEKEAKLEVGKSAIAEAFAKALREKTRTLEEAASEHLTIDQRLAKVPGPSAVTDSPVRKPRASLSPFALPYMVKKNSSLLKSGGESVIKSGKGGLDAVLGSSQDPEGSIGPIVPPKSKALPFVSCKTGDPILPLLLQKPSLRTTTTSATTTTTTQSTAIAIAHPLSSPKTSPQAFAQSPPDPNVASLYLPVLRFTGEIQYIFTNRDAEKYISDIPLVGALGFDVEWKPNLGAAKKQPLRPAALIQLSWRKEGIPDEDYGPEGPPHSNYVCHLYHICMLGVPDCLRAVLENPLLLKVGVGVGGDAEKLRSDYGINVGGVFDVASEVRQRHLPEIFQSPHGDVRFDASKQGLRGLAMRLMSSDMSKDKSIRCGNWEQFPLSNEQKVYGATDAFASLRCYEEIMKRPIMPEIYFSPIKKPKKAIALHPAPSEYEVAGPDCPANPTVPVLTWRRVENVGLVHSTEQVNALPSTKEAVYNMFMGDCDSLQLSISSILQVKKMQLDTVLTYLADAIFSGRSYEWNRMQIPDLDTCEMAHFVGSIAPKSGPESCNGFSLSIEFYRMERDTNKLTGLVSKPKGSDVMDHVDRLRTLLESSEVAYGACNTVDLRETLKLWGWKIMDAKQELPEHFTFGSIKSCLAHLGRLIGTVKSGNGSGGGCVRDLAGEGVGGGLDEALA